MEWLHEISTYLKLSQGQSKKLMKNLIFEFLSSGDQFKISFKKIF